ncbi:lipopolysaccharide biosynthesis protein [Pedobacter lusitanus]|uniref:Lipopolysaccharide biosynthesis protein n=1 Tax=Pedobacter lusitanus TaxID=1503925 RepID=A0A0D0FA04_9SPHI|nr:Wzz/FepE/Etk N-terminal domain-containing protein [Pedobacter lusitanus]KIO78623.1 lipopolysaccharide biosynthesis protein [Pedobacter lusitanus]
MEENTVENKDEISLRDIIVKCIEWFHYLKSKWLIIGLFALLGGGLGFVYTSIKKTIYTATTSFVLEEEKGGGGMGSLSGLASIAGVDLGGGGGLFQGDNIVELYKSRSMIEQTLLTAAIIQGKKQLLIDRYIESNKLRDLWSKQPDLKGIDFSDSAHFTVKHDSIIGQIVKDLNTRSLTVSKPDKKLSIIEVKVKSQDEAFAKAFAEQIVSNVNAFYVQTKTKKSLFNVNILQKQTDSVMAVMNHSIYSAASIIDATPNLNPSRQALRVPAQKSQFSAETNKAILIELVKNLEMSKIALRKEIPLIQIIDKPVLPLEKARLGKISGIVFGAVIGSFLIILVLIFRRIFKMFLTHE